MDRDRIAGHRGTFVISWADTEVDGQRNAPLSALEIGVTWSRTGRALRLDGNLAGFPSDSIADRAHPRAQRLLARTLRRHSTDHAPKVPAPAEGDLDGRDVLVVTDGLRRYELALVSSPGRDRPLLVATREAPPANTELWVIAVRLPFLGSAAPAGRSPGMICFTPGTRIRTPAGEVPVEYLNPGDRVLTRDSGTQEILWVGSRRISGARFHAMPHLRPVRFRTGALGMDEPSADLVVSPFHRVLVRGEAARALFRTDEVLVRAGDLVNDLTVTRDHGLRDTSYIHLMTERHEVLWANGVGTESFHPAEADLAALDDPARGSLDRVCPGLLAAPASYGSHARRALSGAEALILAADQLGRGDTRQRPPRSNP